MKRFKSFLIEKKTERKPKPTDDDDNSNDQVGSGFEPNDDDSDEPQELD